MDLAREHHLLHIICIPIVLMNGGQIQIFLSHKDQRPLFPLTYTIHIKFKDGTTTDITKSVPSCKQVQ